MVLVPTDRSHRKLSNGAKTIKNGYMLRKLKLFEIDLQNDFDLILILPLAISQTSLQSQSSEPSLLILHILSQRKFKSGDATNQEMSTE